MRGKQRRLRVGPVLPGLIPARAGKTLTPARPGRRGTAHPRACGENGRQPADAGPKVGSSPRVRGKPELIELPRALPRLIPARAGKTGRRAFAGPGWWAHPRACGENADELVDHDPGFGSSPRVRGKPLGGEPCLGGARLIPARAGKTAGSRGPSRTSGAHPRACGENSNALVAREVSHGSSPRVRGKRPSTKGMIRRERLIPARAGKTFMRGPPAGGRGAHPRACGENRRRGSRIRGRPGSSPRVRGKLPASPPAAPGGRLIPARAGKTRPGPARCGRRRAHPRACGENRVTVRGSHEARGSSPRVRGKRPQRHHGRQPHRLIPARAGKTWRGR